jgi:hypothetical protein
MSIIKDFRGIYNNIPNQEPPKQPVTSSNPELLDRAVEHLSKQPIVAPNIARK